jgi:RimJ/RimL family protein N-acetyltransferase
MSTPPDLTSTPEVARRSADVTLADGTRLLIRPIVPGDADALADAFERLSPLSRYRRFFTPMTRLSSTMLRALTEIDYVDRFAWVAFACEDERTHLVGVSRYIRLDDPQTAEVAVVVVDPYQGRGIGTLLLDALVLEALRGGICRFHGSLLAENRPMRTLLEGAEARFTRDDEPGATHFEIDLPARAEELRDHPLTDVFRSLARGDAELYRAEPCPWTVR